MSEVLPERARVLVDFDKTLSTTDGGTYFTDEREKPRTEVIDWVNARYREGHTIIVHSSRPWSVAAETVALLTEWGVRWHGLRFEKGGADIYLDDKSFRPSEILNSDDEKRERKGDSQR